MPAVLSTNTGGPSVSSSTSTSTSAALRPLLSVSTFARRAKSTDNVHTNPEGGASGGGLGGDGVGRAKTPISADERAPMLPQLIGHHHHHQKKAVGSAGGGLGTTGGDDSASSVHSTANLQPSLLPAGGGSSGSGGAQNPYLVFQHIHDVASKRISTLDYLRKA